MKIWLLIALNFACTGVFILLTKIEGLYWLTGGPEDNLPSYLGKLSNAVYEVVIFLLPSVIFANALSPDRFYSFKLHIKVPVLPLILGTFSILISVFFVDLLYAWNKSLFSDPLILEQEKLTTVYTNWILQMPDAGALLLCLLMNAFIPAFVEEIFFRVGIQQLMMNWVKKHHVAILISAGFFSFLHFDPTAFIWRFILGAALGYLFYWSGSLRLSILAHFSLNAFTIVSSFITQHHPESFWAKMETTTTLGIISLVVSVGALLTCRNLLVRRT